MTENQNVEWGEDWRDEYIKWICGFANAHGRKLIIGVNDEGIATGIPNVHKLLKDISNKIFNILEVIVDVNLKIDNDIMYLEIVVKPYPYPVSYNGQYHYRSGSTKQELKGAALDKFPLQKQGKRWYGVPVPNISIKDLDNGRAEPFNVKP
ncbi:MAG: ATP-binding protein [Euryarchaeota archaeon]|nr:ATP-binding protein [Euryarchaeota archaeon]